MNQTIQPIGQYLLVEIESVNNSTKRVGRGCVGKILARGAYVLDSDTVVGTKIAIRPEDCVEPLIPDSARSGVITNLVLVHINAVAGIVTEAPVKEDA